MNFKLNELKLFVKIKHTTLELCLKTRKLAGEVHNKFYKFVLVLQIMYSSNHLCFLITSIVVGFLMAHLPTNLVPSTLGHYLESRLEKVKVP